MGVGRSGVGVTVSCRFMCCVARETCRVCALGAGTALDDEFRAQSVSRRESATKCDAAVTGRDYLFRGCDAGALTICFEVSLYHAQGTCGGYGK